MIFDLRQGFRLGPWNIEPLRGAITGSNGQTRHVEPKVMEVLVCLAEHANKLVGRDQLLEAVWSGQVTADELLTGAISDLRQALQDGRDDLQYIETVPKRGYRLIGQVRPFDDTASQESAPYGSTTAAISQTRRRILWTAGVALVVAVVVVLGLNVAGLRDRWPGRPSAGPVTSIAVLPFENRSAEEEDEFFVGGIHDDILTQLTKISALKVISRSSVMEYRDRPRNLREIGQELGVATILEGSVQRAGNTIRISVQLIDAETDNHLWAQSYDRELNVENIFAMQTQIATAIAAALQATLSPEEVDRLSNVPTQSARAYDYYLSGKDYEWTGYFQTGLPLAVRQYERAVEEDPEFALALARLSRGYIGMYRRGIDRSEVRRSMALSAVQRALELEPDLPEAHLAMVWYHYQGFRDYEAALRELAIAEQGMPSNPEIIAMRAFIYRRLGQWEQALASLERAIELDPRNVTLPINHGNTYLMLRDYAQAERHFDRALEILPDAVDPSRAKAWIPLFRDGDVSSVQALAAPPPSGFGDRMQEMYGWTAALYERDYDGALSYLNEWEIDIDDRRGLVTPTASFYGVTYQLAGQPELAERQFQIARPEVEDALELDPQEPRVLLALGQVLAGLGETHSAVRLAYQAMALLPKTRDAYFAPRVQLAAVMRVLLPAGATDSAIRELDTYLAGPGRWSIEGLLPDPRLDPIRDDPRFQALVEKYKRP